MDKHEHHHCECKHGQVRYCAKCRVVHCLGCNKEWRESVGWTSPWTTPWVTYTTTAAGTNIRASNTTLKGPIVNCSHEVSNVG
jgi:hypothetical protein